MECRRLLAGNKWGKKGSVSGRILLRIWRRLESRIALLKKEELHKARLVFEMSIHEEGSDCIGESTFE